MDARNPDEAWVSRQEFLEWKALIDRNNQLQNRAWEQSTALAQRLATQLQATEYAVHAMLQVAPDLESVADSYLTSMDKVADILPEHAAERYRDAFQAMHAMMLAEINRRMVRCRD
ncbi:hypothetical protein [Xylophilus sp. Leaf220]|uniref:hypothetical protein n=1 Tax=Xylophilus sp. Leaf220 TaxID=1735686 RepID=UPI0006FB2945|nr:hypothetical protein [Xylophilus sp. Leaf220]KQM75546.1 hypothetical protein ASE76_06345 [Xylophilus sp. Leaf220]